MTQDSSLPIRPDRKSQTALPFALFVERYRPIVRESGSIQWGTGEVRPRTDRHEWWTVIEEDRTYLVPGYRSMFSVAYVRCEVPWTGEPHDHPYYCYAQTKGKTMTDILPTIMPPKRVPTRPRPFDVFVELFEPIDRDGDGRIIWQPNELPEDADPREWWTIIDGDTGDRTFLVPGFRFVNRVGYIRCTVRWGGERNDHPVYRFF